jgi:hypothetical protein
MERIVLEVDESAGEVYYGLSTATKRVFGQWIGLVLKKAANDGCHHSYLKLLDKTGGKAIKNCLTPEILDDYYRKAIS